MKRASLHPLPLHLPLLIISTTIAYSHTQHTHSLILTLCHCSPAFYLRHQSVVPHQDLLMRHIHNTHTLYSFSVPVRLLTFPLFLCYHSSLRHQSVVPHQDLLMRDIHNTYLAGKQEAQEAAAAEASNKPPSLEIPEGEMQTGRKGTLLIIDNRVAEAVSNKGRPSLEIIHNTSLEHITCVLIFIHTHRCSHH